MDFLQPDQPDTTEFFRMRRDLLPARLCSIQQITLFGQCIHRQVKLIAQRSGKFFRRLILNVNSLILNLFLEFTNGTKLARVEDHLATISCKSTAAPAFARLARKTLESLGQCQTRP